MQLCRHLLVAHLDQCRCLCGFHLRLGDDDTDRLVVVVHRPILQQRELASCGGLRLHHRQLGCVEGGQDLHHARRTVGCGGVHRHDLTGGDIRRDQVGIQHALALELIHELGSVTGLACDLELSVVAVRHFLAVANGRLFFLHADHAAAPSVLRLVPMVASVSARTMQFLASSILNVLCS